MRSQVFTRSYLKPFNKKKHPLLTKQDVWKKYHYRITFEKGFYRFETKSDVSYKEALSHLGSFIDEFTTMFKELRLSPLEDVMFIKENTTYYASLLMDITSEYIVTPPKSLPEEERQYVLEISNFNSRKLVARLNVPSTGKALLNVKEYLVRARGSGGYFLELKCLNDPTFKKITRVCTKKYAFALLEKT